MFIRVPTICPTLRRVLAVEATRAASTVPVLTSASKIGSFLLPTSAASWRKLSLLMAKSRKMLKRPFRNASLSSSVSSPASMFVVDCFLFEFSFSLFLQWIDCDFDFDFVELKLCRASDKCQREKRKTINGDDLLWAMATLGFEDYIDPLKIYLTRYREVNSISIYCFSSFSGPQWK